ncbi:MAG: ABC transporter ATP-binding protein [Promethearchaeota archaeon]
MESVIETKNLTKFFGEKNVVYRLSMNVPKGGIFGFLGPNGAGKSTTIKMLTGLIRPSSGSASIFGLDTVRDHVPIMKRVGYLPEAPVAYGRMTPHHFLRYMARLHGMGLGEARQRAYDVLDFVGLGRMGETPFSNLSAGQKQRLGLANALIHDPELIILDEPTANLDPLGRVQLVKQLKMLVREYDRTILISSHILPEIERLCDFVGVISAGNLVMTGKVSEIISKVEDNEFLIIVEDSTSNIHAARRLIEILQNEDSLLNSWEKEGQVFVQVKKKQLSAFRTKLPQILNHEGLQLRSFRPVRSPIERAFLDALHISEEDVD